jgi:hypothetical protein
MTCTLFHGVGLRVTQYGLATLGCFLLQVLASRLYIERY